MAAGTGSLGPEQLADALWLRFRRRRGPRTSRVASSGCASCWGRTHIRDRGARIPAGASRPTRWTCAASSVLRPGDTSCSCCASRSARRTTSPRRWSCGGDARSPRSTSWETGSAEARRLEVLHLDAEDWWLEARLASGGHEAVVAEAEAMVGACPTRERRWQMLALAQYRSGRQADALETLRRARTTLVEELGLDPGPELAALDAGGQLRPARGERPLGVPLRGRSGARDSDPRCIPPSGS